MKKILLLILLLPTLAMSQTITTIAGTGILGDSGYGGPATAADMHYPLGIARDPLGNIYMTNHDHANFSIRKIDAAGIYTKFAGTGALGYTGDGGPATAATFNDPFGVCLDKYGNLYIAEGDNNVIRKINTAGIVSTVAGNGLRGFSGDGGQATNAKLSVPFSVRVDTGGNIFIADGGNNVIRKVNKAGIIVTIAGQKDSVGFSGDGGPATAAKLDNPSDIAIDSSGNIYISDYTYNVIRMIDKKDTIHTVIGSPTGGIPYDGDGGPATAAHLWGPIGMAFDSSWNLLIADTRNNRIRKVTPAGIISTIVGTGFGSTSSSGGYAGDGGAATAAELYFPYFIALGPAGSYYITDESNNVIRKVDTSKPKNTLTVQQLTTEGSRISVLPNPNNGAFTIKGSLSATTDGTASVVVHTMSGQTIYQTNTFAQKGIISADVTLQNDLPNGIYMVEIKTTNERSVTFLTIQR